MDGSGWREGGRPERLLVVIAEPRLVHLQHRSKAALFPLCKAQNL